MPGINPNVPHPINTKPLGLVPMDGPSSAKPGSSDPNSSKSPTGPLSPTPSTSSDKHRPLGGLSVHDGKYGTKGPMSFSAMPFLAEEVPGKPSTMVYNEGAAKTASSFKTYAPGRMEARSAGSADVVPAPVPFNPLDIARAEARKVGLDFPIPGSSPTTSGPTMPVSPAMTRRSTMSAPKLLTIPERHEGKPIPGPTTFSQIGVADMPEKKTKWYDPRTWGST